MANIAQFRDSNLGPFDLESTQQQTIGLYYDCMFCDPIICVVWPYHRCCMALACMLYGPHHLCCLALPSLLYGPHHLCCIALPSRLYGAHHLKAWPYYLCQKHQDILVGSDVLICVIRPLPLQVFCQVWIIWSAIIPEQSFYNYLTNHTNSITGHSGLPWSEVVYLNRTLTWTGTERKTSAHLFKKIFLWYTFPKCKWLYFPITCSSLSTAFFRDVLFAFFKVIIYHIHKITTKKCFSSWMIFFITIFFFHFFKSMIL